MAHIEVFDLCVDAKVTNSLEWGGGGETLPTQETFTTVQQLSLKDNKTR